MKKAILLLVTFLTLNLFAEETLLPKEKSLIEGRLENGFNYSIMYNKKPEKRAEFRLMVKIGSLEEREKERGIAHFIEHMAFNGSTHFKKNELVDYLEKIGITFGSDLNANTGFEKTQYMLTVPLENDNLEESFLVFSDWASGITFDQKELDKERGVVLEEARLREGVGQRMYDQYRPLIFGDTRYAKRLPIGKKEVIENITVEEMKAFYTRWYRPEFMHFVAVGDFNTTKIEELIKTTFSSLKNSSTLKREARYIPENNTTRILTAHDKEVTSSAVSIYYMDKLEEQRTKSDLRRGIVDEMMIRLFNMKAQEQIEKQNPKATMISLDSSGLNKNRGFYNFTASYKKGDELPALNELYAMIWSFKKYGFSKEYLAYIKESMLSSNEKDYENLDDLRSSTISSMLMFYADSNSIFVDYDEEYKLKKELINDIKIEEINRLFNKIINFKDRAIIFANDTGATYTDKEVLETIEASKANVSDLTQGKKLPKTLKIQELESKKIVSREYNKETDIHQFTLENGIEVAFKQTDFRKNSVALEGISFGGTSLYEPKDLLTLARTTLFVSNSGIGKYSVLELTKILANKKVSVSTSINPRTESFSGSANSKDVESMFKVLYLQLTQPKIDERIAQNIKNMLKESAIEALNNPKVRFQREGQKYFYKENPRIQFETNETIEKLDEQAMLKIYKERFADCNNFKVVIIGDVKPEEVERLSQKYLGNLPTVDRNESFVKRELPYRHGNVSFIRNYNNENISHITLAYKSKIPYTEENGLIGSALQKILNIRLRKLIREEKSGVYGISARVSLDYFELKSTGSVTFSCDPKRKDELLAMVYQEIEKIKTKPITKEEMALFRKSFSTFEETALKENWYWMSNMKKHYKLGTPFNLIYKRAKMNESITAKDIEAMARKIFVDEKFLVELNPKESKGKK